MLAFVGLLLFALMGFTAVALDVGVARLSQERLEVVAEYVALESARGRPDAELRPIAEALLAGPDEVRPSRVGLGAVSPLATTDPGCSGEFPTGSEEGAVLARRVPLLFGHGSMLAFASPSSFSQIQDARLAGEATPVLPDAAIPPDRHAFREQGFCIEGQGRARLEPALAVAGAAERRLPGTTTGLSLRASDANPLWQTRSLTRETTCAATVQGGAWFRVETSAGGACEDTSNACSFTIAEGAPAARIGDPLSGMQASLVPSPEPIEPDAHGSVVAALRDPVGDGDLVGFATLCTRLVGTSRFVSFRWSDQGTPTSAFTSELRNADPPIDLAAVRTRDGGCRHPDDASLRCYAQAAVLALGAGT